MEIQKRHALRKSDFKELKKKLAEHIGESSETLFEKTAEIIIADEITLYAENKMILAFEFEDIALPSLRALNANKAQLPTVTVDMGAIPYVTNGADIMAPGITKVDDSLAKDTIVAIIDENYGKSLAIGKLLVDSKTIIEKKKGKVIKNLHYVNDSIWTLSL